jgi:anaerobic selenocysteine-containing dehydrogenase
VGAYIVNGCDPAYSSPEGERFEYALKDEEKLPLIVCIDTHVTDTGMFADVVLPAATYLEEYGLEYTTGPGAEQVIGYRQPVVQPLEESKPYVDILAMLAKRTGTSLGFLDSEDYVSKLAGAAKPLPEHGREELLAQKGFFVASAPGMVRQAAAGIISGKIRLEWDDGHRLPSFVQPPEHKEMKAGELMLVVYSPVAYREGFTENNILLKEIYHKNRALINSATGAALGLKDWDTVSISSVAGKVNAVVTLTPGMHPRAIALARGCGHNGYGNIEKGEKFNSPDPFTKAIWWKNEGTGTNPNRLVSFNMDNRAIHGLPLTRVTIEKAPEERENG